MTHRPRPRNCTCHGDPQRSPCAYCEHQIDTVDEMVNDSCPDPFGEGADELQTSYERWLDTIGGSR